VNEDAELLERIRNGEPDAFAGLVRRHQDRVFAILHRYEPDPHRLEDLAQETFVKAWRFLDRFDGRAPFHHWLSRIAVRTALDYLRRQKRVRSEIPLSSLGESALDWLVDEAATGEPEPGPACELLEAALRQLSPEDRVVLTLLEIEERTVKEICALTGFSSATVRVRAFRARARLKKVLLNLGATAHE